MAASGRWRLHHHNQPSVAAQAPPSSSDLLSQFLLSFEGEAHHWSIGFFWKNFNGTVSQSSLQYYWQYKTSCLTPWWLKLKHEKVPGFHMLFIFHECKYTRTRRRTRAAGHLSILVCLLFKCCFLTRLIQGLQRNTLLVHNTAAESIWASLKIGQVVFSPLCSAYLHCIARGQVWRWEHWASSQRSGEEYQPGFTALLHPKAIMIIYRHLRLHQESHFWNQESIMTPR